MPITSIRKIHPSKRKFTDDRTLRQIHAQLMDDLKEVISDQELVKRHLMPICKELGILEECMALKWSVDCDCFYR